MTGFIKYLDVNCNYNPNPFLVASREDNFNKNFSSSTKKNKESARLVPKVDTQQPSDSYPDKYELYKLTKNLKIYSRPPKHLKERNVFERLTDHRFFTGIHRERFDENGKGRGMAGREYLYLFDGNTESYSRSHEVYSSVIPKPHNPVVPPNTLGRKKFGVQVATPKLMWLYRNGDKHHDGIPFYVRPYIKTMNTLLVEIGKELTLIAGPVRKLYDQNLHRLTDLSDIVDGAKYLCTSGEPPASPDRLEKFMSEWVIQKMF